MGMNKIICSNIMIRFKDGRVNNLSFYRKPDASFIPPHELKDEDIFLKGYSWKIEEKPTREEVVKGKVKEPNQKESKDKALKEKLEKASIEKIK
jgi:hypothetical protein